MPSDNKRLRTVFLLDEENALLHSFNTSINAKSHLAFDSYAKVTRSPPIKAHNIRSIVFISLNCQKDTNVKSVRLPSGTVYTKEVNIGVKWF